MKLSIHCETCGAKPGDPCRHDCPRARPTIVTTRTRNVSCPSDCLVTRPHEHRDNGDVAILA